MESVIATQPLSDNQHQALALAINSIAPNWPLDQMIAVNPLWQRIHHHFDQVAADVSLLAGAHCYMDQNTYYGWYRKGLISDNAIHQAASEYQVAQQGDDLITYLTTPIARPDSWRNIADWADQSRPETRMSWHDEITHQISQFCAAHYQKQRPMLQHQYRGHSLNLYQHWLQVTRMDRGLSIIMSEDGLHHEFNELPDNHLDLISLVANDMQLSDSTLAVYAQALLLDINGWGAYLAYRRFEAQKAEQEDSDLLALLAIKLAWEWVIWRYMRKHYIQEHEVLAQRFAHQVQALPSLVEHHKSALIPQAIWARALELSEQSKLEKKLLAQPEKAASAPRLQAIFCIDVRSEVYRRALEQQDADIETYGFAGFFGLPIEYKQAGTQSTRPQLPGLLAPSIQVFEQQTNEAQLDEAARHVSWHRWGNTAAATFSMVESMGWWYAFKMFKKTCLNAVSKEQSLRPASVTPPTTQWTLIRDGSALTVEDQAQLAKGVLDVMGLPHFAPTVMLVGHGSRSCNNLQSAGLECGACGGQTGEVNVRVLAQLLNDDKVRKALIPLGYNIPNQTQFVPALHNTITDHVTCYIPPEQTAVQDWLQQATYITQQERAFDVDPKLMNMDRNERDLAYQQRANDWSQTRPEWGLADNNAFIIAPRALTRGIDLEGRAFLHDYQYENDPEGSILERLLTAPMLVTHWINMQYNLSTTDNFKFGSGNKVLHNAVGDHIGLFEGNGGDLRIGLATQSIYDGERWMHTPQRLNVYIRAAEHTIAEIVAKHEVLQHLIHNEWLYVFVWQEDDITRFYA